MSGARAGHCADLTEASAVAMAGAGKHEPVTPAFDLEPGALHPSCPEPTSQDRPNHLAAGDSAASTVDRDLHGTPRRIATCDLDGLQARSDCGSRIRV